MPRVKGPLFLARSVYRKRRLRDAARLLPILGTVLFMLPRLWHGRDSAGMGAGQDVSYIFLVWAGLIASAAFLSVGLAASDAAESADAPDPSDGPSPPGPAERPDLRYPSRGDAG